MSPCIDLWALQTQINITLTTSTHAPTTKQHLPKNYNVILFQQIPTTIVPGQLWHKLYCFYFCRIFQQKTEVNVKDLENSIMTSGQIRTHNQCNKVAQPFSKSN
jgi:hypothetical protein